MLLQAATPAQPPTSPPGRPPPGVRPSIITNAIWTRKPVGEDMARVYPQEAAGGGLEGQSNIQCTVTAAGDLADCAVFFEMPPNQGFGLAALRLAPLFHMQPLTKDGQPVAGGTIRIPIRFLLPRR